MSCVPPHGPHSTKSHQGGPGCSCCRSRLPQTQAQGTEIRARPAAAPARTGSAGAEPARERRRGNGGRTAGQTVSGAGSARAAAAAAFLPELVFPGSALLLPRKPRAAGSHGAPLGRRRAHTARSNTPGQERSREAPRAPWAHPQKSLPPQVTRRHRHAWHSLPTRPWTQRSPTHRGLGAPQLSRQMGPRWAAVPTSAHGPLLAQEAPAPTPSSASRRAHLATPARPQILHSREWRPPPSPRRGSHSVSEPSGSAHTAGRPVWDTHTAPGPSPRPPDPDLPLGKRHTRTHVCPLESSSWGPPQRRRPSLWLAPTSHPLPTSSPLRRQPSRTSRRPRR